MDSRVHGSLGRRVCHRPPPPGGVGDAQQKEIEQKEMDLSEHVKISSCQTCDIEIEKNLNAACRSDEFNIEKEEIYQIDLNAACRIVEDQPN